jgi:DNA-binding response OmpR family regulator
MRIIYIEDNKLDFDTFAEVFSDSKDFDIVHYEYLEDFLNRQEYYDVVVTDLFLPDAYGPEVLQEIRKVTDKPIIALSGVGGLSPPLRIRKAIEKSGATFFASKNKNSLSSIKEIITNLK